MTAIGQTVPDSLGRLGLRKDYKKAIEALTARVTELENGSTNLLTNLLSTSLLDGGITTRYSDTEISISAGKIIFVNNYTDTSNPKRYLVEFENIVGLIVPYLDSEDEVIVYARLVFTDPDTYQLEIDFSPTPLTNNQKRDFLPLAAIGTFNNTINYIIPEPPFGADILAQLNDFTENWGSFNIEGNVFYANGANLKINKSAGLSYDNNNNFVNSKKSPSILESDQFDSCKFHYYYKVGNVWQIITPVSEFIDPDQYNELGTGLLPVPLGKWTVQNIFHYAPLDNQVGSLVWPEPNNVDIQYGQVLYDTKEDALSAINDIFELNPFLRYDTHRTWLVVQQGATVLNDETYAVFKTVPDKSLIGIGSGGGGVGGEFNTINNAGTAGFGLFINKTGVVLNLRNLVGTTNQLNIGENGTNKTLEISLADVANSGTGSLVKITRDSKGRVTGTENVTLADIEALTGVKQAELISGTNIKTIDGQSLLGSGNISSASLLFYLEQPTTADTKMGRRYLPAARTITRIAVVLTGSSSPSVTWKLMYGTDISTAGTAVITSGTTSTTTTTAQIITSFDNPNIPTNNFLWIDITAKSGTVNSISIEVFY